MNKDIVKAFGDKALPGIESNAQWIYFPNQKYGFVAIVEINEETWMLNDNGEVTSGDYEVILKKCMEIVERNK